MVLSTAAFDSKRTSLGREGSCGNVSIKDGWILKPAFLALGFGPYFLYLPLFALYFLLKANGVGDIKIKKQYLVLASLLFVSIIPLYVVGHQVITLENPLRAMAAALFMIILVGFAFQTQKKDIQYELLLLYVFGIGLSAVVISVYSYGLDPEYYGYGRVIDPLSGRESNSPRVSNNLAIFGSLLLYFMFVRHSWLIKTFLFGAFLAISFLAIFLGGRAYFLVIILAMLFLLAVDSRIKAYLTFIFMSIAGAGIAVVVSSVGALDEYIGFILSRASTTLVDVRFDLYKDGFINLLHYPFGGFSVDPDISSTKWFHNVFLDNARLGGWFPVIFLVVSMVYISWGALVARGRYIVFASLLFFVSVVVMQQDVVVEGNFNLIMVMYLCGLLILAKDERRV